MESLSQETIQLFFKLPTSPLLAVLMFLSIQKSYDFLMKITDWLSSRLEADLSPN